MMIPRLFHIGNSKELFLTIEHFPTGYPAVTIPHRHDYFEVLFFTSGDGVHCIDDNDYPVSGNDLFLLSEGQVHYFKKASNLSGYLLCFKEYSIGESCQSLAYYKTSLFNQLSFNIHMQPDPDEKNEIVVLLEQLIIEQHKKPSVNQVEIISGYLKILLIKIRQLQNIGSLPDINGHQHQQYLLFLDLLERYFKEQHEAAWYADKMAITPRALTAACSQYSGENTKTLISKRLLIEARRTLQFTQTPIKDIAASLHFSDPFQFSKFFKKSTSHTPVAYRKQFAVIDMH
ncbi:AraC family transcriptional regulator [Flavobacterium sp. XGLA_31]|uniref:AraC family transcriptional regulator n=1 Tax=Flavobacterium sp. XGLA_31 TaxID=3447666 RepID=UPI003F3CCD65